MILSRSVAPGRVSNRSVCSINSGVTVFFRLSRACSVASCARSASLSFLTSISSDLFDLRCAKRLNFMLRVPSSSMFNRFLL